ncbi:MAG: hypothetical protein KGH82_01400 [Candidatus Micrarchaeota archaeon]|nr:hypothetical protein [Candidatus Micrarchaeota archaeon]
MGIYCIGEQSNYDQAKKLLGDLVEDIYFLKNKSKKWKWMNGDLSLRQWYIDRGKELKFDFVYNIEWDMLFLKPLAAFCKNVPKDGLALSGLIRLGGVEKRWYWTKRERKKEWHELLGYAKSRFNYRGTPYASIGSGFRIPRKFLDFYSEIEVPQLCHDELRMPLFGQLCGLKLYDTRFFKWFDTKGYKFFNAMKNPIKRGTIEKELAKPDGRRAFHPYYSKWAEAP